MALNKEFTSSGYTINYWIITEKSWDKKANHTACKLSAFESKETRDLGLDKAIKELSKMFRFEGDLSIAEMYEKIKLQPISPMVTDIYNAEYVAKNYVIFTDAIDC